MIKHVALLKAKTGLHRDEFIKHCEEHHVPLALKLIPDLQDYRRSYLVPDSMVSVAHVAQTTPAPSFDVITELWCESQTRVDELMHDLGTTNTGTLIAEHESDLFDRTRTIRFAAEEHATADEHLAPRPIGYAGHPPVKMVCLLKRKPGMSRADFITYYETRHAPLALKLLASNGHPLFAQYRRSYPSSALPKIGIDVMTEIWFWTQADYRQFQDLCSRNEIAAALSADEENLFDRNSITMFLTDERTCPRERSDAATQRASFAAGD